MKISLGDALKNVFEEITKKNVPILTNFRVSNEEIGSKIGI